MEFGRKDCGIIFPCAGDIHPFNLGSNDVCAEYTHDYGSLSYVQPSTPANIVSIEAEHFIQRFSGSTHLWEPDNSQSGASITAVQARPNAVTGMGSLEYLTTSPRLDYRVNFARTGIHYVWIRGYAAGTDADSVEFISPETSFLCFLRLFVAISTITGELIVRTWLNSLLVYWLIR
jgi:hypothetical protein